MPAPWSMTLPMTRGDRHSMTTRTTEPANDAAQDRQRARTARGVGGRAAAPARPAPPRRRRPAVRMDSREPVLVLRSDVPAGTEITTDLLGETNVASDSDLLVPADAVSSVLGTYSRVPLSQGQLLDTSMLVRTNPLAGGEVAEVGIPLVEGRVPEGLGSGDLVRIVRIGESDAAGQPLAVALVVKGPSSEGGGGVLGGGGRDDGTAATLLVPIEVVDAVVDAAGNNRIGMALVDRGVAVTDTDRLRALAVAR